MNEIVQNTQETDLTELSKALNTCLALKTTYQDKQYIYLLVGPDELPLYVGKTKNILARLVDHTRGGEETWYEKLRHTLNGKPIQVKILEIVDKGDESRREQHWINYYLDFNPELFNTQHKVSLLAAK